MKRLVGDTTLQSRASWGFLLPGDPLLDALELAELMRRDGLEIDGRVVGVGGGAGLFKCEVVAIVVVVIAS